MSNIRFALLALAFASVSCRPGSTGPVPASANSYVHLLGNDTLAAEQFTRVGSRVEGTLVVHLPRTIVTRYAITLDSATGRATTLEYNTRLPNGGIVQQGNQAPLRSVSIAFGTDSAVRRDQRDTVIVTRAAAREAFPYINYSVAFFQLAVSALRASKTDTAAYVMYTGGRATTPVGVRSNGSGRYTVSVGGFPYAVSTADRGVVQSVDGARTTQHFVATRQGGTVDVAALAAAWGQREGAAPRAAALSPRDTVTATIGSAQLWVDYGRPTARGRKVFGATGVLNDSIWRTGANAATQFRTNVPLTIAGQTVPAGTYTLWTLAIPGRYQLIVNKQVGQWGTVYDPKQDLVRVPLSLRQIPAVVDRFTIEIDAAGASAGVLKLRWDTTELSVPFTTP
jgi:hypothetical protein